jgi:pilus assembly protein Flp/PilA
MLSHMRKVCGKCVRKIRSQKGQGLVEYALILVLIAIVVITAVKSVGTSTSNTFSKINTNLQ